MRRRRLVAVVVALATFWHLPRVARAEPCEGATPIAEGRLTPCGGILVSPSRAAQCVEDYHERHAAEGRLAGCIATSEADKRACEQVTRALRDALDAERTAARDAQKPQARTDWSALGWGFAVGLVVGVGAAVAVAWGVR